MGEDLSLDLSGFEEFAGDAGGTGRMRQGRG